MLLSEQFVKIRIKFGVFILKCHSTIQDEDTTIFRNVENYCRYDTSTSHESPVIIDIRLR